MCYYQGWGVEKDLPTAFKYFKLSTEQNDIESYSYLGNCYTFGEGTEKNIELGFKNF